MKNVYKKPLYYDIAFSFVDVQKQIKEFQSLWKKYGKRKVKNVLDLGCGHSPHLIELAKLGFSCTGLDLSTQMLEYLKSQARTEGVELKLVKTNFCDFSLSHRVDFAFMLMGTISYIQNNEQLKSHLNSVAKTLNRGGVYLIENLGLHWADKKLFKPQTWTMKRNNITVTTTFKQTTTDELAQTTKAELSLETKNSGTKRKFSDIYQSKIFFPQEFIEIVNNLKSLEFIGFLDKQTTTPLKSATNSNYVLLRKR